MPNNSENEVGRAFEYVIVEELSRVIGEKKILLELTERAKLSNTRDKTHLSNLDNSLKENLKKGAKVFIDWVVQQGWLNGKSSVSLDRLPDAAGVEGDPTDIRLTLKDNHENSEIRNISIKHHHSALKHPRLPRLPDQCGIKDKNLKKEFNDDMDKIWNEFLIKAKKLNPQATDFSELKEKDVEFINENIYKPLLNRVCEFLNEEANNPENTKAFFSFLTGRFNFYTIKNEDDKVLIKYFLDIKQPKSFEIVYPYNSITTFLMRFDNGWDLSLRLHTASSSFIKNGKLNQSTKLDVHCINLDKVIKIEEISKS